jgi:hypothetical protein
MSTGSIWDQSTFVMSPRFGISGWWWARTLDASLSNSQKKRTSMSLNIAKPRSSIPAPENSDPTVIATNAVYR